MLVIRLQTQTGIGDRDPVLGSIGIIGIAEAGALRAVSRAACAGSYPGCKSAGCSVKISHERRPCVEKTSTPPGRSRSPQKKRKTLPIGRRRNA